MNLIRLHICFLVLLFQIFSVDLQSKNTDQVLSFKSKFNKISLFFENAHVGVRDSIVRGFKQLHVPYTINPKKIEDIGDIVFCLDNVTLLERAIDLKKKGIVKKIIVGPNILARTYMSNHILSHPAIDYYLTPSEWNMIACIEDEPPLKKTIRIWPAGIDAEYWKPAHCLHNTNKAVMIYWKNESYSFIEKVQDMLIDHGWHPVLIKYGNYSHQQYKDVLHTVKFAVFISQSESQGLALAECWSMNIPTLVWDPKKLFYLGKNYDPVTACPYLTDQTGKRWKEFHELEYLLKNIESYFPQFRPREWILNNMSDEVSINLLLEIINE